MRRTRSFVVSIGGALLALAVGFSASGAAAAMTKMYGFAGYYMSGYTPYTSSMKLSTTIVVPKLKCGQKHQAIQAITQVVSENPGWNNAGMVFACRNGKAQYQPNIWGEQASTEHARPGDRVVIRQVVSGTCPGSNGGCKLTSSVIDKTHRKVHFSRSRAITGQVKGTQVSAGVLAVDQPKELPVPNFGTLKFSATKVNGQPLRASGVTGANWYSNNGRTLMVKTTDLSASGESFKEIFKHH